MQMKLPDINSKRESVISRIIESQDANGCWNVLKPEDKYYPYFQYYCPNYKSTLWTLIFLADLKSASEQRDSFKPAFDTVSEHFFDSEIKIYTIGKSHFPIPCLNGNMIYPHAYFNFGSKQRMNRVIDFFYEYQRFDDGDFSTPKEYPYFKNKSCYGRHTCYWGVTRLFKGLSFIPPQQRSSEARKLIERCIDFILPHEVCFSSRHPALLLHTFLGKLGFPNMYKCDFLELLWLLKREGVDDPRIKRAVELLKSRQ